MDNNIDFHGDYFQSFEYSHRLHHDIDMSCPLESEVAATVHRLSSGRQLHFIPKKQGHGSISFAIQSCCAIAASSCSSCVYSNQETERRSVEQAIGQPQTKGWTYLIFPSLACSTGICTLRTTHLVTAKRCLLLPSSSLVIGVS
jgi:hypothetical protein